MDNAAIHKAENVSESLSQLGVFPDYIWRRCSRQNGKVENSFSQLKKKVEKCLPDHTRFTKSFRSAYTFEEVVSIVDQHIHFHNFEQPSGGYPSRYHRWIALGGGEMSEKRRLAPGELDRMVGMAVEAKVQECRVVVDQNWLSGECLLGRNGQEVTVRYCPGSTIQVASAFDASSRSFIGELVNENEDLAFAREIAVKRLDFRLQTNSAAKASRELSKELHYARTGKPSKKRRRTAKAPSQGGASESQKSSPVSARNPAIEFCEE